jgi:hypothetical protein
MHCTNTAYRALAAGVGRQSPFLIFSQCKGVNSMFRIIQTSILFFIAAFSAHAEVTVQGPWVRATVAQQKVTGAFMAITSTVDAHVVGITSPVADRAEIHEMKMDNDIMTMRAVPSLPLGAGKTVSLAPGGYHIMLFGLHQQVKAGDSVPLTLLIEDGQKQRTTVEVKAIAKSAAAH